MHDVFLGIGSNVGDRIYFLAEAVQKLKAISTTSIIKISSVYETEPVGIKEQNSFLNAAVWLQTSIDVHEFHSRIKSIEKEIGRQERMRWGPREIDIDILLFDDLIVNDTVLKIPHPEMHNRKFVLQPLAEISPEVIHPVSKKSIKELHVDCKDANAVERSAQLTETLITKIKE